MRVFRRRLFSCALVALITASVASCVEHDVASSDDVCGGLMARFESGPEALAKYLLTSTMTGSGQDEFVNIDLDRDDKTEVILRSCPSGVTLSDPCVLTISLSRAGYSQSSFDVDDRFSLMRYGAEVFMIVGDQTPGLALPKKVLKLGGDGPASVCEF